MEVGTKLILGEWKFVNCPNCEDFVKRVHSLQADRLELSRVIKDLKDQLRTGEQRVAREIEDIVDGVVRAHGWSKSGSCGINTAIKSAIKNRYRLEDE